MSEFARASQEKITSVLEFGKTTLLGCGLRQPELTAVMPTLVDGIPVYSYTEAPFYIFAVPANKLFERAIVDAQTINIPDSSSHVVEFSFWPSHQTDIPVPLTAKDWLVGDSLKMFVETVEDAQWPDVEVTLRHNTDKDLYEGELCWDFGVMPPLEERGCYMDDNHCDALQGLLRVLPHLVNEYRP